MARTVVATAFGGSEVLQVLPLPVRDPEPGEVTIQVRAAGVNPTDYKGYRPRPGATADATVFPMALGYEVSGTVTAVGADAVGPAGPVRVGDEVIGYRVKGGYSSALTTSAAHVLPKPARLSWEQAAGLLLTATTGYHMLESTRVSGADTVLISGASGSAGLAAAQLARLRGARVLGTASPKNFDLLRRFGVEPLPYGEGLVERVRTAVPEGVDVALDAVGTDEAIDASVELVADRDRIATIAGFGHGAEVGIRLLGGGPGADPGTARRTGARLMLVELAAAGQLEVVLGRSFPLENAGEAHDLVRSGHPGGKVVLLP